MTKDYDRLFITLCVELQRFPSEVRSRRRDARLVKDREIIAAELRKHGLKYEAIGALMNRDQSAIQYLLGGYREKRKARMREYHKEKKAQKSQVDARRN